MLQQLTSVSYEYLTLNVENLIKSISSDFPELVGLYYGHAASKSSVWIGPGSSRKSTLTLRAERPNYRLEAAMSPLREGIELQAFAAHPSQKRPWAKAKVRATGLQLRICIFKVFRDASSLLRSKAQIDSKF